MWVVTLTKNAPDHMNFLGKIQPPMTLLLTDSNFFQILLEEIIAMPILTRTTVVLLNLLWDY